MVHDLKLIDNFNILYDKNVFIYGAGKRGKEIGEIATELDINFTGFCDSDNKKWNTCFLNKLIISPEELSTISKKQKIIIIIAFDQPSFIVEKLTSLQLKNCLICTFFGFKYAIYFNIDNQNIPVKYREEYKNKLIIWKAIKKLSMKSWQSRCPYMETKDLNPIFIMCPGKTGSFTMESSLNLLGIENIRFHDCIFNKSLHPDCANAYEQMRNRIFENNKSVKIITSVREPISKDIAHFFQKLSPDHENIIKEILHTNFYESFNTLIKEYTYEKNEIKNKKMIWWLDYVAKEEQYGPLFNWFLLELKEFCGINIYHYPFDQKKGYTVIKKNNIEIFIFQLEKISFLEKELGDFVGAANFKIVSSNTSKDKLYKYAYKEFLENVKLPKKYIDFYYKNNPCFNHFYNEDERKYFYNKWLKHLI